ncbi:MAG: peptidoglycan-binding domain-containing protein [Candidatus Nealsonbacteria bacterium]
MPKYLKVILIGIIFLSVPSFVLADYHGQKVQFYIESGHDLESREQTSATLRKITDQLYFYIDDDWWDSLDWDGAEEVRSSLDSLSLEFENKIYLNLVSYFGPEWTPGIDNDRRITILIHPMVETVSGYFNPGDEYPKAQVLTSNEREMVYLNASRIGEPNAKSFLAHEFVHLITFNQKEKTYGIPEETWLNEARAEHAPTLLGYDDEYQGSNLQNRVKEFLKEPSDSLIGWRNLSSDYGVINVFFQYLVDHYGIKILVDSLHSGGIGIPSLDYTLEKNGFSENFQQIFTDWTIAILINDCSVGEKYCYLNPNLKNLKINPLIYFLPLVGEATLNFGNSTQNWSGNWHKFIGGSGHFSLEFSGSQEVDFKIPYLLVDKSNNYTVKFLELGQGQKGILDISGFNSDIASLVIIPTIQSKTSDFGSFKNFYPYFWKASVIKQTEGEKEEELIESLLAQIEYLQNEIAKYQNLIAAILGDKSDCQSFENNLYYGMKDSTEVRCLQQFLRDQGADVYPEGLVTGNFLTLTLQAVIRFQEKYKAEILAPIGLEKGTGYFGFFTRQKAGKLIHR